MTENLKLWDKVSRVPKEHLKQFDRGTFKGTAIKPAWAIKTITEALGPCGTGWTIGEPVFKIVEGVKGEMLVYCTVCVNGSVYGVGGDKIVKYTPANDKYNRAERWDNDDEAFKKAYTDALTNALVKLGVGADIHMGLWDGNKYIDGDDKQPINAPPSFGNPLASKAPNRDGFNDLVKQIRDQTGVANLKAWFDKNRSEIDELPEDFVEQLRIEYADKHKELVAKAAA